MEVKGGIADRCNTASLDEARKLLWWKKERDSRCLFGAALQGEADMASFAAKQQIFLSAEEGEGRGGEKEACRDGEKRDKQGELRERDVKCLVQQ